MKRSLLEVACSLDGCEGCEVNGRLVTVKEIASWLRRNPLVDPVDMGDVEEASRPMEQ